MQWAGAWQVSRAGFSGDWDLRIMPEEILDAMLCEELHGLSECENMISHQEMLNCCIAR